MSGIFYPLNYKPLIYKFMKLENLQKIKNINKIYHILKNVNNLFFIKINNNNKEILYKEFSNYYIININEKFLRILTKNQITNTYKELLNNNTILLFKKTEITKNDINKINNIPNIELLGLKIDNKIYKKNNIKKIINIKTYEVLTKLFIIKKINNILLNLIKLKKNIK